MRRRLSGNHAEIPGMGVALHWQECVVKDKTKNDQASMLKKSLAMDRCVYEDKSAPILDSILNVRDLANGAKPHMPCN